MSSETRKPKEWIVYMYKGKELLRATVFGGTIGDMQATKELLAFENKIPVDDIKAVFE